MQGGAAMNEAPKSPCAWATFTPEAGLFRLIGITQKDLLKDKKIVQKFWTI